MGSIVVKCTEAKTISKDLVRGKDCKFPKIFRIIDKLKVLNGEINSEIFKNMESFFVGPLTFATPIGKIAIAKTRVYV